MSVLDGYCWYITRLCLSWTIDWYINWFCLSLIIIVGISPTFFCRGQNWSVYQPDLSVVVNNGWYINRVCLSGTVLVDISPSLFLSWTILVVILTGFVCHGQK